MCTIFDGTTIDFFAQRVESQRSTWEWVVNKSELLLYLKEEGGGGNLAYYTCSCHYTRSEISLRAAMSLLYIHPTKMWGGLVMLRNFNGRGDDVARDWADFTVQSARAMPYMNQLHAVIPSSVFAAQWVTLCSSQVRSLWSVRKASHIVQGHHKGGCWGGANTSRLYNKQN